MANAETEAVRATAHVTAASTVRMEKRTMFGLYAQEIGCRQNAVDCVYAVHVHRAPLFILYVFNIDISDSSPLAILIPHSACAYRFGFF